MSDETPRLFLLPISAAAPGALYDQIVTGLKREISEGRLMPGASLPSFRQLAADLMVSLMGDAGKHARFAVGVSGLPFGVAVEVDATFELK